VNAADARAGRIALVWMAWKVGHNYADHIGQDSRDAREKGEPGWKGRAACARHIVNLTATKAAALALAGAATGVRLSPRRVAVAMAIDAASHYVIDRRTPLRRLAAALGKTELYELGDPKAAPCGTGAYVMDQAAHDVMLLITALYAGR